MSMFVDAFLGSGAPLAGDPITSIQNVPLLGLRTATIVYNGNPMVRDIVKVRFIARNCGERPLELVRALNDGRNLHHEYSEDDLITLPPDESLEYSVFRSWDAPGAHQLAMAFAVRCAGHPLAQLSYPVVAVHVRPLEGNKFIHWLLCARPAHLRVR